MKRGSRGSDFKTRPLFECTFDDNQNKVAVGTYFYQNKPVVGLDT